MRAICSFSLTYISLILITFGCTKTASGPTDSAIGATGPKVKVFAKAVINADLQSQGGGDSLCNNAGKKAFEPVKGIEYKALLSMHWDDIPEILRGDGLIWYGPVAGDIKESGAGVSLGPWPTAPGAKFEFKNLMKHIADKNKLENDIYIWNKWVPENGGSTSSCISWTSSADHLNGGAVIIKSRSYAGDPKFVFTQQTCNDSTGYLLCYGSAGE